MHWCFRDPRVSSLWGIVTHSRENLLQQDVNFLWCYVHATATSYNHVFVTTKSHCFLILNQKLWTLAKHVTTAAVVQGKLAFSSGSLFAQVSEMEGLIHMSQSDYCTVETLPWSTSFSVNIVSRHWPRKPGRVDLNFAKRYDLRSKTGR